MMHVQLDTGELYSHSLLKVYISSELRENLFFVPSQRVGSQFWRMDLKGYFVFFEVGSYKKHIYSRSVPYRNHRSALLQFEEVESRSSPEAQLCTAVNRVQRKS